jgi:hypothetical protein
MRWRAAAMARSTAPPRRSLWRESRRGCVVGCSGVSPGRTCSPRPSRKPGSCPAACHHAGAAADASVHSRAAAAGIEQSHFAGHAGDLSAGVEALPLMLGVPSVFAIGLAIRLLRYGSTGAASGGRLEPAGQAFSQGRAWPAWPLREAPGGVRVL